MSKPYGIVILLFVLPSIALMALFSKIIFVLYYIFYILKYTSSLVAIYFKTEYALCLKCDEGDVRLYKRF